MKISNSIKSLKDRRRTFDVEVQHAIDTMTAADVKSLIEAHEGVPVNTQRLVFSDRPLNNDMTLSECRRAKAKSARRSTSSYG